MLILLVAAGLLYKDKIMGGVLGALGIGYYTFIHMNPWVFD